jgi:3-deoxy-D-manno-octulosonic-acid transferase
MGELQLFYAAADVAIIGGSFIRNGGQNPLESFAVGVPVILGPHMFHFEEITALALERGAARQVPDAASLDRAVALYLAQPDLRAAAGAAALSLIRDNQGALDRTLRAMTRQLARTASDKAADVVDSRA